MSTKRKKIAPAPPAQLSLSNCNFVGVQYDARTVEAIIVTAKALEQNAASLGTLAGALAGKGVTIGPMIRVDGGKP